MIVIVICMNTQNVFPRFQTKSHLETEANFNSEMDDCTVGRVTFVDGLKSTYRPFFLTYEKQELAHSHFSALKRSLFLNSVWFFVLFVSLNLLIEFLF